MVDDEELEKLREERMQDLESGEDSREEDAERQRDQIRQKAAKYLTSEAKSRLGNIRAAKPDLASSIEMQIARLGDSGQIEKVGDDQLKDILRKLQNSRDESDIKHRSLG
ncbi:MAG: DNA-binding protein [Candidatus Nanohaloarchaea archaeon]